jgi:hypothetical protein
MQMLDPAATDGQDTTKRNPVVVSIKQLFICRLETPNGPSYDPGSEATKLTNNVTSTTTANDSSDVFETSTNTLLKQVLSRVRQGRAVAIYTAALQKSRSWNLRANDRQVLNKPRRIHYAIQPEIFRANPNFSQVPAVEFLLFPALPSEIVLIILGYVFHEERVVEIRYPMPPWPLQLEDVVIRKGLWARPPPLSAVCSTIREETRKFYSLSFTVNKVTSSVSEMTSKSPAYVYYNKDFDSLVIPSEVLQLPRVFDIPDLREVERLTVIIPHKQVGGGAITRLCRLNNKKSAIGLVEEAGDTRSAGWFTEIRLTPAICGRSSGRAQQLRNM